MHRPAPRVLAAALLAGALAAAGARGLRRRLLPVVVDGPSMLPTLRPGNALLVRLGAPPRPGDVVVACFPARPDLLVVKRAVRREGAGWWVESDNPAVSDDSRRYGAAQVLGRVVLRYWPPAQCRLLPRTHLERGLKPQPGESDGTGVETAARDVLPTGVRRGLCLRDGMLPAVLFGELLAGVALGAAWPRLTTPPGAPSQLVPATAVLAPVTVPAAVPPVTAPVPAAAPAPPAGGARVVAPAPAHTPAAVPTARNPFLVLAR